MALAGASSQESTETHFPVERSQPELDDLFAGCGTEFFSEILHPFQADFVEVCGIDGGAFYVERPAFDFPDEGGVGNDGNGCGRGACHQDKGGEGGKDSFHIGEMWLLSYKYN